MERRLYGPGARLALLVSLCMMSAPTTQGNTEVIGAVGHGREVVGAVGRGRDFVLSSVEYLGYHGAAARRGCCRQCTREYPGAQMFSYNTQAGICACMKRTPGVNPTTTEGAGSFAGICGGRGRGRSQRRRRAGRRGRGRRAGAVSPSSTPTMAPSSSPTMAPVKQREDEHLNEGDHDSDVIQNKMDEEVDNTEQSGKWVWSEASNKWVWKISKSKGYPTVVSFREDRGSGPQLQNPCVSKLTCSECLKTPTCGWCMQPDYLAPDKSALPRCNQEEFYTASSSRGNCDGRYVVNPSNEFTIMQNVELRLSSAYQEAVQVKPQQVQMKLRLNEAFDMDFYFEPAEDCQTYNAKDDQYEATATSIEMNDNSMEFIRVTYFSSCLGDGPMRQTSRCSGLGVGTRVAFTAKIEVVKCPKDPREWKQQFNIYPVGINERVLVDLEMICDCDCEKPGNEGYEENSSLCNGKGTYKCGICECPPDSFGRNCECDADNLKLNGDLEDGCRPDNNSTTLCNNRGDCTCGKCECYPRDVDGEKIMGDFCECDNFSCDRHNGLLCSGPDHGECVCGKCSCNSEWDSEGYSACECRASQWSCITPYGEHFNKVCSGHGTCSCGECICTNQYSGKYCQDCPTCPGKCSELKPCVECQLFKSGEYMDGMDDYDEDGIHRCDKCPFMPIQVDTVDEYIKDDERLCSNNVDDDGCRFTFAYGYTQWGQLRVWAQKTKECSEVVDINDSQKLEADPKICLDLVACVQCQQFKSGDYMDGVDDVDQDGVAVCDKCQFKPVGVELKEEGWKGFPSLADDPVCTFIDDDMCSFSFIYRYHIDGGLPMVWVQKNKKC